MSGFSAQSPPVLLVVEDDEDIARALHTLLNRAGYRVLVALDGKDGLRRFHAERPQLVILDIGLPSLDGWALLERIRDMSTTPVLMLTARDSETEKVRGLRGGADDYLTKPFGNQELLARVEAILRRFAEAAATGSAPGAHSGSAGASGHGATGQVDDRIRVDIDSHTVEMDGTAITLTPTEWRLLETLLRHRGQVLSTEQLLRLAWRDPTATGPDRVKFTMLRLRRKLGWDEASGPIETVRGFGYRLRAPAR